MKGDWSNHGRRNFKEPNPLMSSLLVIFVWGGEAVLQDLLQNMVYSTIQHPPPPPPPQLPTVCIYCKLTLGIGGGGGRSERRQRGNITQIQFLRSWGQQFTSQVEKRMYLQSINSFKHNAVQSVNFKRKTDIQVSVSLQFIRPWV